MKAGIVGLPNVGKSTLFNCLSNAKAQSANFPFCTIEPNVGVVNVPDPRLSKLESLVDPEKVIPATVEIVDIAGLVKGASKGEGLGNQFLANIRETDAILHVLRCFDNDNIVHVDGSVDPIRDKDTIDMELQLKDLETVEKKLEKVKRTAKTGNKEAQKEAAVLEQIKAHLEAGKSVRSLEVSNDDFELYIKPLQFITAKPVLYVCNVDENAAVNGNAYVDQVISVTSAEQAEDMHANIRSWVEEKYNEETAKSVTILYGGSCKPENAKELFACPNIDGGLIGGAALKADDFCAIINAF